MSTRRQMIERRGRRAGLFASMIALAVGGPIAAQSRQIPAPPQSRPTVIAAAAVHPVTGPTLTPGYVVFEKGRITHVGQGEPPAVAGAEVINAAGLHVYPGLIGSDTTLGLVETSSVAVTNDTTEFGRITPEARAVVAINPDSDHIPVTRADGIMTALVFPRGGLVSGRCSTIRLDGWTWEDMAIDPEAGLVVNWPRTEPSTRGRRGRPDRKREKEQRKQIKEELESIEQLFDDAAAYLQAKDADPAQPTDLRYEAMRAALGGAKPIFVRASSQGQIESAIAWAVRRELEIVIVGGREAEGVIALLRKHDVPVIITGLHHLPRHRHDAYDSPFTLPAKLHEAGVRFAIASGSSSAHERALNDNAATAVPFGLPAVEALRAITIGAAEIIGLGETHGSIEVGKAATLIVTTGDPLQITTDTRMAFIDGRRIDLGNRHKSLYGKYREKYRQQGKISDEVTK